ncbi:hypothetical protein RCL1_003736 [Eukaryota sp. TZLM3-RCL]
MQALQLFSFVTEEHLSFAIVILVASFITFLSSYVRDSDEVSHNQMSMTEAARFPFVAAAVLTSLFLVMKFASKIWLNRLLTVYFVVISGFAMAYMLSSFLSTFFSSKFPGVFKERSLKIKFLFVNEELKFDWCLVICLFPALLIGIAYALSKHWILNNVLALVFCLLSANQISVPSFKVGTVLLLGLFVYDCVFVFKTPIMVSVATGLDLPIKLVFPRFPVSYFISSDPEALKFSLLGLGDIILPAIFIRLVSKYEVSREKHSRVLYTAVMFAYTCACVCAIFVMLKYKHAQPVLLYIVPMLLVTTFIVALCRGELGSLLRFTDKPEEQIKQE